MKTFKKNRILRYCVTATLPFCLTGCMGIYEGGFECPAGIGVGCKSISEVNDMVNGGLFPNGAQISHLEFREGHSCDRCHQKSLSDSEHPEIWINPLYLQETPLEIQEIEAEKEKGEELEETQPQFLQKEIKIRQGKDRYGTISL